MTSNRVLGHESIRPQPPPSLALGVFPKDIWLLILDHLSFTDLLRLEAINSSFRHLAGALARKKENIFRPALPAEWGGPVAELKDDAITRAVCLPRSDEIVLFFAPLQPPCSMAVWTWRKNSLRSRLPVDINAADLAAHPSGRIFVASRSAGIHEYLHQIPALRQFSPRHAASICVSSSGEIYASDPKKRRLYQYSVGGDLLSTFSLRASCITVGLSGDIFFTDPDVDEAIMVFSPTTGAKRAFTDLSDTVNHICIDGAGNLLASATSSVQLLSSQDGRTLARLDTLVTCTSISSRGDMTLYCDPSPYNFPISVSIYLGRHSAGVTLLSPSLTSKQNIAC